MQKQVTRFDLPNRTNKPHYFLGERSRLATMTAVAWISPTRMVAGHLCAAMLLLLGRDDPNSPWRELDRIDNTFAGEMTIVDLLSINSDGMIVCSNFDAGSGTLYRVQDDRLRWVLDLPLPEGAGHCHGASFYDDATVCLQTDRKHCFFLDAQDGTVLSAAKFPHHVKDMVFLDAEHALAACALGSPSPEIANTYASCLLYVRFNQARTDFKVLDKLYWKPAAFDAIAYTPNTRRFYIADQFGSRVLVGELVNGGLRPLGQWGGLNMVHGIHVLADEIAVTTYGDSTVEIFDLSTPVEPLSETWTGRFRPWTAREVSALVAQRAGYYIRRARNKLVARFA